MALASDADAELGAELATLESQAASPKPEETIIRESLLSLRRILESAAGSAAGRPVMEIIPLLGG